MARINEALIKLGPLIDLDAIRESILFPRGFHGGIAGSFGAIAGIESDIPGGFLGHLAGGFFGRLAGGFDRL
jgi:hypothetical protein